MNFTKNFLKKKKNYSFVNNEKYVDVYNFGKCYEDTIAISKSDFNISKKIIGTINNNHFIL